MCVSILKSSGRSITSRLFTANKHFAQPPQQQSARHAAVQQERASINRVHARTVAHTIQTAPPIELISTQYVAFISMTVATFELPRCIAVNPGMMPDGEDDRKPPIKPACEPLQHWSSSSASSRPSSVASDEPPSASSLEEPTPFSIPRAGPAPPDAYLCPISCQLMTDPVTLESGHTFDRGSIRQWFAAGRTTCPLTRRAVDPASLQPNTTLKTAIQDWVRAQDDAFASVPLADRPLEVVSGHFLIPRQQPQSGSAEDVLSVPAAHVVQLLERAGTSDEREALIQVLLTQAAVCNRNKHAIIATGVIPTLVWLVFSAETCTLRWYAAELVSFLTTIGTQGVMLGEAVMSHIQVLGVLLWLVYMLHKIPWCFVVVVGV